MVPKLFPSMRNTLIGRRILLFPQGNANGQPNDMVSVYLDYANPKTAPEGWHACAQFCLAISNPADPTVNTSSRTSIALCPEIVVANDQTHTTDSLPKNAIGDSRDSLISRNCIRLTHKLARPEQQSRMTRLKSPPLSGC